MFTVTGIKAGTCIACGKTDTECYETGCAKQMLNGLLCAGDFKRQVKILAAAPAPAGSTSDPSTPRGEACSR